MSYRNLAPLISQRLSPPPLYNRTIKHRIGTIRRRNESSVRTNTTDKKSTTTTPQKDLKWTERETAPKWMINMAPSRGGTELPSPKEAAVIAVMMALGYYAWFVDPGSMLVKMKKYYEEEEKESAEGEDSR